MFSNSKGNVESGAMKLLMLSKLWREVQAPYNIILAKTNLGDFQHLKKSISKLYKYI